MHWIDIEEIAEALDAQYPHQDLYTIRFTDLREWVIKLEGFVGEPARCNEKILEAIQSAWFALRAGEL